MALALLMLRLMLAVVSGSAGLVTIVALLSGVLLAVLLVGASWLLWHVLCQQGRLLLRLEAKQPATGPAALTGPPVSTPVPASPSSLLSLPLLLR